MGLKSWLSEKFPKTAETVAEIKENKASAYNSISVGPYSYGQTGGGLWKGGLSRSGAPTVINRAETLQNGRSNWHRSPQARSMINTRTNIAVDKGLKVEPQPAWDILGITDEAFQENWVETEEEKFDLFMSGKQIHRSGTMTGYQLQRLWETCDGRDNDQFMRFFYSGDRKLVSPLQLEPIDPTQVIGSGDYTDSEGQVYTTNDGISRNAKGEEIAYKVRVKKKTETGWKFEVKDIPARGSRSKRVMMIHGYEQEYPGQGRGFSRLHFAIQNLENIVDLTSATIKKATNQADMVGFVEPSENSPASNPHESRQDGNIIPVPDITDDTETGEFCFFRPEYDAKVPGSDFIANLMPGEKMKFLEDTAPGPQFDAFVTSVMKWMASAYNLPIEVVLKEFNKSYSASRAALLMAWQIGGILQDDIKADLMDYVWEMWLSEEIAAGRTQAPGWNDPRLKQAWTKYRLQGPPLPSIDPMKDSGSDMLDLKMSVTTQERIARARTNSSAKQNAKINAKQFPLTPTVPFEDEPVKAGERTPDSE